MIQINVKNISHHPLPDYATLFSSGMDIYAYIDNEFVMKPMEMCIRDRG